MRSTDSRTCASEIPTRPSPLKGDSVGCGSHVWSPGLQNNSSHTFGIHTGPCPPSSSCFVCYGLFQPRRTFVDIVIRRRRFLAGTQKLEARLKTNDDEETNFRLSILSVSSRRQRTLLHQFLILQLGPEFSRNSRLRADALPADRAGDSDAGCGKFSPGST
jgi:hypothetical protein